MRSFSTDRFGQRSHDKSMLSTKSFERFDFGFRNMIEKCMKRHQNEDLRVSIPGIGSKFRAESNGDGPAPQNLNFRVEKLVFWGKGVDVKT